MTPAQISKILEVLNSQEMTIEEIKNATGINRSKCRDIVLHLIERSQIQMIGLKEFHNKPPSVYGLFGSKITRSDVVPPGGIPRKLRDMPEIEPSGTYAWMVNVAAIKAHHRLMERLGIREIKESHASFTAALLPNAGSRKAQIDFAL